MRISNIIELGKTYLLLGLIFACIVTVLTVIGYRLIYRQLLRGKKAFPRKGFAWLLLFLCYLTVVLGATLLERNDIYDNSIIQPLFYSYRLAWCGYAAYEWRNIILNILLFVPFGFWLSFGIKFFRHFYTTYLAGFLFTVTIEITQLYFNKGIFELDDIMDNTMGAMIGYGIFALWNYMLSRIKKKKASFAQVLALQIPLIITVSAFLCIYLCYQQKELGNLSIYTVSKAPVLKVTIADGVSFSEEAPELAVYQLPKLSVPETQVIAENCFHALGTSLDESQNDIYDQTAVYSSFSTYQLWINYVGGVYRIMDFSFFDSDANLKQDATDEEILAALSSYPFYVPKGVTVTNTGNSGRYIIKANQIFENDTLYDGQISLQYFDNGRFYDMDDKIYTGKFYKNFPCISATEAFKQLSDGNFNHFAKTDGLYITVNGVSVSYMADTKSFYQPIYSFDCMVNGVQAYIRIPALQ